MKRFVVLVTIIMCVVLTGCQVAATVEKTEVSAVITEMQYKSPSLLLLPVYNSTTKTTQTRQQVQPAQYLVTVTYEDISETLNDKDLYETVKEGDTIQMVLCQYYDMDGILIQQTLQLN